MKTFNITFPFQVKFHPRPLPELLLARSSHRWYACANTIATILFRHPLNWVIRSHKASRAWNARNKRALSSSPDANCTLDPPLGREGEREKRSIRYGESIFPRRVVVERDSSPSSILREWKTRIRVPGMDFGSFTSGEMSWVEVCVVAMREARRWRDLAEVFSRIFFFFFHRFFLQEKGREGICRSIYLFRPEFRSIRGSISEDFACGGSVLISNISRVEGGSRRWRYILNCEYGIWNKY